MVLTDSHARKNLVLFTFQWVNCRMIYLKSRSVEFFFDSFPFSNFELSITLLYKNIKNTC